MDGCLRPRQGKHPFTKKNEGRMLETFQYSAHFGKRHLLVQLLVERRVGRKQLTPAAASWDGTR